MLDVAPEIHASLVGRLVRLEARIVGDAGAPLPWRFRIETSGPGGRSVVTQSGIAAASGAPVSQTSVGADAHVHAVLQVDGPDGRTHEATLDRQPQP